MSTVGEQNDGMPDTVPARMVNEFVYCPRLFYLEWVQSRFASNDDWSPQGSSHLGAARHMRHETSSDRPSVLQRSKAGQLWSRRKTDGAKAAGLA